MTHLLARVSAGSIFLAMVLTAGCAKEAPKAAATKDPVVVVAKAIKKQVTDHEDFQGHTDAVNAVDIRTQVTGYLEKIHFKDGQDVQQGDLLFEIDPSIYEATFEQTTASAKQAKAHLDRVSKDYDRVAKLANTPAMSKEDVDRYYGDKLEAEAALAAAEANRKLAETNLKYTKIRAKFAGRLSKRNVDPGNIVKANDTILTSLVQLNPIYVSFDVDERTLLRIRRMIEKGEADSSRKSKVDVDIALSDDDDYSLKGTIDFSDNRLNQGTGTLSVRATLNNDKLLLSPGLFVRVRIPVGRPHEAILIPEEALAMDQGQRYLFVVNDKNEVVYRRVKIGMQVDQYREIKEGLSMDERVITKGLQRVKAGVKVVAKTDEDVKTEQEADKQKKAAEAVAKSESTNKESPKSEVSATIKDAGQKDK